jgi:hypothetical protein
MNRGNQQEPCDLIYFHYTDRYHEADFIIDISDVFEQRMEAVKAYTTRFIIRK